MSSTNLSQAQDNIEVIFTNTANKLEDVIKEYREIALNNVSVDLQDKINDSCDELEELKETIRDTNQMLLVRLQCVNNICDNIDDIVLDIHDFVAGPTAPTHSEKIHTAFNNLKALMNMHESGIPDLNTQKPHQTQEENENYFLTQKAALEAIITDNPELNNDF